MGSVRPWQQLPHGRDERYMRAWKQRPKGVALDVYRADTDMPVLVFHHIRKTGGTSLRHLIAANLTDADLEIVPVEEETQDWFEQWWQTAPDRDRIVCLAGHSANLTLRVIGRAFQPFAIIREPVDRAASRYHFARQPTWTLEELAAGRGAGPGRLLLNGQARELLAPYHPGELPETEDHPDADLWRARLREAADLYVLGVQDRMVETLIRFGQAFGWSDVNERAMRVNETRPPVETVPVRVREGIATRNWLDRELYLLADERLPRH